MTFPAIDTPVKVQWLDSTSLSGWHYLHPGETVDSTPRLQTTRGVLVALGETAITVASTVSPPSLLDSDTGYMHLLIVPKGAITALEVIP